MTRLEVYSTSKGDITQHQGSFGQVVRSYDTIDWVYSSMGGVSWLTCGCGARYEAVWEGFHDSSSEVYSTSKGGYYTISGVSGLVVRVYDTINGLTSAWEGFHG